MEKSMKYFKYLHVYALMSLLFVVNIACSDNNETMSSKALTAEILELGLPVVIVETVDREEPTCDYIYDENGAPRTITNATKVPGRLYIVESGDTIYDSGLYENKASGMTLKIRGNSSAFLLKSPYKIKLQKKADLLNPRGGGRKDKNWLLLNDYLFSLNLMIGLKVNELVGLQWTPQMKHVNVIVNGDYKGNYMLCESVERNEDCRLNVNKNEGYIIENDSYAEFETKWFNTGVTGTRYTFKYPDEDDLTEEHLEWIKNYMYEAEMSMYANTFDKYIDLKSFAKWMIGHDILGTSDWSGSNIFMTVYDKNAKLMMANMWDFDTNYIMEEDFAKIHTFDGGWVYPKLFTSENPSFRDEYIKQWDEIKTTFFPEMDAFLNNFLQSEELKALERSRLKDVERWNHSTKKPSVADNVERAKKWFSRREKWLSAAIPIEMSKTIDN